MAVVNSFSLALLLSLSLAPCSLSLFLALTLTLLHSLSQALIIRDFWLLNVISVAFELMEYTLECQLPNFGECWWDHVRISLNSDS